MQDRAHASSRIVAACALVACAACGGQSGAARSGAAGSSAAVSRPASSADREDGLLARASRGFPPDARGGGFALGGGDDGAPPPEVDESGAHGGTRYGGYRFDWPDAGWRRIRSPYAPGYRGADVTAAAGAIEGRVVWPRPPAIERRLPAPDPACGDGVPNDTLTLDRRGNVANAVVYLRDIRRGRRGVRTSRYQRLQIGGVLAHRGCRMFPHVQLVAPIGSVLRVHNGARVRHVVAGRWLDSGAQAFSLDLVRGARGQVYLGEPGIVKVTSPLAPAGAWVIVPAHPYYEVTDGDGRFRLDDVPPGRYELVVWHEPVIARGVEARPVSVTTPVTVSANRTRSVTLRLPAARPRS